MVISIHFGEANGNHGFAIILFIAFGVLLMRPTKCCFFRFFDSFVWLDKQKERKPSQERNGNDKDKTKR